MASLSYISVAFRSLTTYQTVNSLLHHQQGSLKALEMFLRASPDLGCLHEAENLSPTFPFEEVALGLLEASVPAAVELKFGSPLPGHAPSNT